MIQSDFPTRQPAPKIGENGTWLEWDELTQAYVDTGRPSRGDSAALSGDIKAALLTLAQKVAYVDEYGQDYYDALYAALYPPAELLSISASFAQGSHVIHDTDSLDTLKQYLVVTAHYDDNTDTVVSNYTLSGTLTEGTSTITANYGGQSDTFNVTVTHAASEHTVIFSDVIDETLNDKYFDGHTFEPTSSRTGMRVSTYIPVTEGTSITFANGFKYPNLNAVDMVFYDSGKTILSSDNATYGKKVFTVPAGASYFRFADDVSNTNNTITSFY